MRKILGVGEGKSVGELEKETLMKTGKTVGRLDIKSVKCVGEACWGSVLESKASLYRHDRHSLESGATM